MSVSTKLSNKKKIFSNGALIASGQVISQLISLLRNAMMGHLLSKGDFGIASLFMVSISLVEMMSNVGIEKILVQAKEGDDENFQATAHLLVFIRGVIAATILYILAPFIVNLLSLNASLVWAFQALAIVPLLKGLMHLDLFRLQRHMNYKAYVLSEFISQSISCAAIYPLIMVFESYVAIVWVIVIQYFILFLSSHAMAKRRYRFLWNAQYFKKILRFGWPVLMTGILLFGIFQGDKLIVGAFYSTSTLAVYSAAFMLTMAASILVTKITTMLLLPYLSSYQDNKIQFIKIYSLANNIMLFISVLFACFFIFYGEYILTIVYGNKYKGENVLISLLGVMWFFRLLQTPSLVASLAVGYTKASMYSGCIRLLALPFILHAAKNNMELYVLVIYGIIGELFSLMFLITRVNFLIGIKLKKYLYNILIIIFVTTLVFTIFSFNTSIDFIKIEKGMIWLMHYL